MQNSTCDAQWSWSRSSLYIVSSYLPELLSFLQALFIPAEIFFSPSFKPSPEGKRYCALCNVAQNVHSKGKRVVTNLSLCVRLWINVLMTWGKLCGARLCQVRLFDNYSRYGGKFKSARMWTRVLRLFSILRSKRDTKRNNFYWSANSTRIPSVLHVPCSTKLS